MRLTLPLALVLALTACDNGPYVPPETGDTDTEVPDVDQDGFNADQDCNDEDPEINPGAAEICDKVDNNCDKNIDEGFDDDGDGHWDAEDCEFGDDCNDRKGNISPSEEEKPYDGIDQDCSGADLTDVDGDGYDSVEVAGGDDCDDQVKEINPGAEEIPYDTIDQDCVDGDLIDVDGDGHDHIDHGGDDCNDDDPRISPSAMDWGNDKVDQDCDTRDGNDAKLKASRAYTKIMGTEGAQEWVGNTITVCDFDGDKADDLLVSAPLADGYQGHLAIWLADFTDKWPEEMTLEDADVHIKGSGANAFFGSAVACGDIDGDGRDDLVVSGPEINWTDGRTTYDTDWKLHIFYGDDDWAWSSTDRAADAKIEVNWIDKPTTGATLYWPQVEIGDLDGDGKGEIVLGFASSWPGRDKDMVAIFPGSFTYKDWYGWDDLTKVTLEDDSPERGSALGAVKVVPDLNGDGAADLAILQPYHTEDPDPDIDAVYQGQVSFFSKIEKDAGFNAAAYATLTGSGDDQIGSSILVDDFDNDGKVDLLLGARSDSAYDKEGGALYMVSDASGQLTDKKIDPASIADSGLEGSQTDAWMGADLFAAGDVDGDGATDFLVREQFYQRATSERDGVFNSNDRVHLIGGDHVDAWYSADEAWLATFSTENDVSRFGEAAGVGDFNEDGASDFVFAAPRMQTYKTTYPRGWVDTGQVYIFRSDFYPWGPSGE